MTHGRSQLVLRFRDCHFHEKERQEREYDTLQESNKHFEHHERGWENVWNKEGQDTNQNTSCKNVSK